MHIFSNNQNGFTLVELLVSIVLLVFIIISMVQLFARGLSATKRSEALTVATDLAQAQIETMLGLEYDNVSTGTFEARHIVSGNFSRQTIVNLIDPATFAATNIDSGLKRITVTVFYPTQFGERTAVLSTLIARQ